MDRQELIEKVTSLNARQRQVAYLKAHGLYDDVTSITQWLPDDAPVGTRLQWIKEGCPEVPMCKVCGIKPCSWNTHNFAFSKWCSIPCMNQDPDFRASIGRKNHANAESRCKKMMKTRIEKYGTNGSLLGSDITNAKHCSEGHVIHSGEDWAARLYLDTKEKFGGVHPLNTAAHSQRSGAEADIRDALVSIGVPFTDIVMNDRAVLHGKELDLYIPSKHIAIEYCGEVWHSDFRRHDIYHMYDKMMACRDVGIQLFSIFGEEWKHRRLQAINLLASKLVPAMTKIGGRECEVSEIDNVIARDFIESKHVQGAKRAPEKSYGLTYRGNLVAVMAFGRHPRDESVMALKRFCCESGYQIMGGASKLLNYALDHNDWKRLVSWSDNRWSTGRLYERLGFTKAEELRPDYAYWSTRGIKSKQSCQKKFLIPQMDIPCENMTEKEMAEHLGLYQIYDCGKIRWELNM